MKGLKEKKKGPSAYKKDRKHQAHIKSMQRRSRTQGAQEEDPKHQTCMESL